jgi:hypothetical protein
VVFASELVTRANFFALKVTPVNPILKDSNGKGITDRKFQNMLKT